MGKIGLIVMILIINLALTGCFSPDLQGIIIKVSENQVLLATEMTLKKYQKIKEKPAAQIQNDDVLGDAYYGLIDLAYDASETFSPGDQVKVWLKGEILESYPLQATAKKIIHKKN